MTTEEIIRTEALNLIYGEGEPNQVHALKNVNLQIKKKDLIAITGPSGSGKSSLLHVLGAMQTPSSGSITLLGSKIGKMKRNELSKIRRNNIGFTFQNFALINHLTALDNVMIPLYPINPPKLRENAENLLERVGLDQRMSHYPNQLSGGEKQRVAIARALINKPSIVLGDEITGNLDSKTGLEIFDLIKDLNKNENITFLLVTHDLALADLCSTRISMNDGVLTG